MNFASDNGGPVPQAGSGHAGKANAGLHGRYGADDDS